MTLLDDRGRLFGRVNLIDAGLVLTALIAGAGVYSVYSVFRLPRGPEIETVEPATQSAMNGARVNVRGRDFLPYIRVFVQRSGDSTRLVHEGQKPDDIYTLINYTQAQWLVESPSTAVIRLPDQMDAGTYDLRFFNETREIAVKRAAFTLTAVEPRPVRPATAVVRLDGAFTQLNASETARLTPGARLGSDRAEESVEIISVEGAQPDVVHVGPTPGAVPARVEDRVRVTATLRVRCSIVESTCRVGGATVGADRTISLHMGDQLIRFSVRAVRSDLADAVRDADVTVRFVLRSGTANALKPGDADDPFGGDARHASHVATLVSLGPRHDVVSRTVTAIDGRTRLLDEPAVTVDAVLRVPLTQLDGVWLYKGQAIKSGGTIAFETPTYKTRAWVLSVALRAPANRTE